MLLDLLQNLHIVPLLGVTIALVVGFSWIVLAVVRIVLHHRAGLPDWLMVKDVMVTVTSAMFALMMAFTAAGIWNDTLQARNAVQREAQALENVLALATGFPDEVTKRIRDDIGNYSRLVAERDWPAMGHKLNLDNPAFVGTDRILVDLIDHVAAEAEKGSPPPVAMPALNQLFEARSARLTRLTLADSGVSSAQWIAMIVLFAGALMLTVIVHNHNLAGQIAAMHIYALASAAAFFVVLAHDRPFSGDVAIQPTPILQLYAKATAGPIPATGLAGSAAPAR
jgi:hypothetical protein